VADVARLARLVAGASGPHHAAVALGLAREVGAGPTGATACRQVHFLLG
jgi:hypothetical protein